MKKIILLPILLTLLSGCSGGSSTFKIESFYTDLEARNYVTYDGELKQIFYDENMIMFNAPNQVNYGVVKMSQGIFEIHETSDGSYETHGMLTPNVELDILDGCHNFHNIAYIAKSQWTYDSANKEYNLKISKKNYSTLSYTGYFSNDDYNSIKNISLKRIKTHEYQVDVIYKDGVSKENYSITLNNYKKNTNSELKEFITNTVVSPQTDWNDYQKSALEVYGLNDIPFLSSYTIGFFMYFQRIATYSSGGYACIVYDYMSSQEKEEDIAKELEDLHFLPDGEKKYYKPSSDIPGLNLNVEYAFISYEELEYMAERGEISPGNLLAYPYGYMQLLFAYSFGEIEISLADLNTVLLDKMALSPLDNTVSFINKITTVDYKDSVNEAAMNDEEYLEMFEELGLEPGPLYEELASYYLYIDLENDAVSYIDNYRESIRNSGYIYSNNGAASDNDSLSIKDMSSKMVEYYKVSKDGLPEYTIDIYLYDSSSPDNLNYDGVVEIVLSRYTELGLAFFFAE